MHLVSALATGIGGASGTAGTKATGDQSGKAGAGAMPTPRLVAATSSLAVHLLEKFPDCGVEARRVVVMSDVAGLQ